ncbi:hypothetical protein Leryth_000430 [Lithospermum erythrorhizon]|nr:hypothetical protein Leryth_000430 [Lithospermum erythrorhizon]
MSTSSPNNCDGAPPLSLNSSKCHHRLAGQTRSIRRGHQWPASEISDGVSHRPSDISFVTSWLDHCKRIEIDDREKERVPEEEGKGSMQGTSSLLSLMEWLQMESF